MSTQSHIDPPADPAAAQERPSRISRRSVLRGAAAGAGAVGLATVAGAVPAMASPRPATAHAGDAGHAAPAGPIVVYLRDAASGELEVFAGDSLVKLHDPAIAARLSRAVR
jgi:hypothetical protein